LLGRPKPPLGQINSQAPAVPRPSQIAPQQGQKSLFSKASPLKTRPQNIKPLGSKKPIKVDTRRFAHQVPGATRAGIETNRKAPRWPGPVERFADLPMAPPASAQAVGPILRVPCQKSGSRKRGPLGPRPAAGGWVGPSPQMGPPERHRSDAEPGPMRARDAAPRWAPLCLADFTNCDEVHETE